ncbi:hypothetical protein [Schinkia azotoformans]|uniref:hypothetical protein n=1 Tax=Schinkia azotoformans TaxID=1454 RepID=UPI002DBE2AFB|nr:hypothetical protein [Schinkia azotoformans]MEC1715042.1 hypothetical protein [Schinkia azotoformans]MEC1745979.1 hypothetical protein [Schinkia azotoformans]MEC1758367.1 hypothetical protein [Schinkia azotoformans]MED4377242.1 hypothetical protein [Schinkia azotoformans]
MLIYFDPSIKEYFDSMSITPNDLEAVDNILASHRKGYHYVGTTREMLHFLMNLPGLGDISKFQLQMMNHEYSTLKNIVSKVKSKIVVKSPDSNFNRIDTRTQDSLNGYLSIATVFEVPLRMFLNPEILDKTKLISEHLDDCYFYEFIAKNLFWETRLPCSIVFDPEHGGGNDTHLIFKDKVEKNYITFAIADSDKKEPDGELGTTAKQVLTVFESNKQNKISNCEILPVHEKENLFSPDVYEIIGRNIRENAIKQLKLIQRYETNGEYYSYLDMKNGLHSENYTPFYEKIFDWPNLIPRAPYDCRGFENEFIGTREEFMDFCRNEKIKEKKEREVKVLIEPLSGNPLGKFDIEGLKSRLQDEIASTHARTPKHIVDLKKDRLLKLNNLSEYLIDFQRNYLLLLSNQIRDWGLSNYKRSAY